MLDLVTFGSPVNSVEELAAFSTFFSPSQRNGCKHEVFFRAEWSMRSQNQPWLRARNEAEHTNCVNYYMSFQVASLGKELKDFQH